MTGPWLPAGSCRSSPSRYGPPHWLVSVVDNFSPRLRGRRRAVFSLDRPCHLWHPRSGTCFPFRKRPGLPRDVIAAERVAFPDAIADRDGRSSPRSAVNSALAGAQRIATTV